MNVSKSLSSYAFLIDMDGLLLDTERLSHISWVSARDELGFEISDVIFRSIIGQSMANIQLFFNDFLRSNENSLRLINVASRYYKELIFTDKMKPKLGASEFLHSLATWDVPRCLVTSTDRALADLKLKHVGLDHLLFNRVCGDDVLHSKPNPEIYLKAAILLGIEPRNCIALEDSANGVRSALAAGCKAVHIPDLVALPDELTKSLYFSVKDLGELLTMIKTARTS